LKQAELINLIASPHKAVFSDLEKLQDLKKQFPFFQSAHMLLTLVSKRYDSGIYQETLRKTAISIPNRARLYDLLNAPVIEERQELIEEVQVIQPVEEKKVEQIKPVEEIKTETLEEKKAETIEETKKEVTEIDHLKAIELHSEKKEEVSEKVKEVDLNEQVEKEVQKQIITSFVEKEILKTPEWYKKEEKKELNAGSFSDWLHALKKVDRVEQGPQKKEEEKPRKLEFKKPIEKKEEQKAIIDKIIDMDPGNIRLDPNQRFFEPNTKAKESLLENEHLVTETLAKIYALQGSTGKAIRAYEILSLRFPQKSAYFASLIENLKKEKDNK
jgi:hypothetical protein